MNRDLMFIAADIHGAAEAASILLQAVAAEPEAGLLLLGDQLSALGPERPGLPPVERQLQPFRGRTLALRGNCDSRGDESRLGLSLQDSLLLPFGDKQALCCHGHTYGEAAPPPLSGWDILITGHSHVPCCRPHRGWLYLNPGSLGRPRQNSPAGYIRYEKGLLQWIDLQGRAWMEYKI